MINLFDRYIIIRYGKEKLNIVCNANMKLVPENIITAMKAAISLECFPADKDSCHRFLGWGVDMFALHKSQGIPLNILFDKMRIHQPSCSTTCRNPDDHFHEFSSDNKCFPIEKVFNVFRHISNNAANKLLDESLIIAVLQQVQTISIQDDLKVIQIPKPNNRIFQIRRGFRVLIINFDILKLDDNNEILNDEHYKLRFDNLIDNLHKNFEYSLLSKPFVENPVLWERHVNDFTKNVNIFIVLLSEEILENISMWKFSMETNENYLDLDFNDRTFKFQNFVYQKLCGSDILKVAVTFDEKLISSISKYFPIAYVLPKEMHTLLCFIDKIRKT